MINIRGLQKIPALGYWLFKRIALVSPSNLNNEIIFIRCGGRTLVTEKQPRYYCFIHSSFSCYRRYCGNFCLDKKKKKK